MPMDDTPIQVTKRSLFSWVRQSNMKLQVALLAVIMLTVATRVLPLELQKKIINEAINLRKLDLLLVYCGLYLAAVVVSSGLKYLINVIQTYLGQEALEKLRKELYHHILTLPLNYFRKTQAGMVVSALVTEIAPAGDFIGQAIAVPVTNVLTLLAFGGYLFFLNPLMACMSLAIYPLVLVIMPRMQRSTNIANKKRVDVTRDMSSLIAESITGVHEIHGNASYRIENSRFDRMAAALLKIRIRWNLLKTGTKSFNNFCVSLAPFLLFIVGGWLIIEGRFDLGSLVAFLSAQEKLYDPWKELMDFYQIYQDAGVRYERTMEYFDFPPEHTIHLTGRAPYELDGSLGVEGLTFVADGGITLLSDINLALKPGEHLALVGFSGSGKSTLALCVGQLYKYTSGSLKLGGQEVADLTKRDIATNIGFVSQSPFIFTGSIKENLLYACQAALESDSPEELAKLPSLDDQIAVLQQAGIFVDVLRFGLNTILAHDQESELAQRIIRVRQGFQQDFGQELAGEVEFFDPQRYLHHSTVAANLTFGSPRKPEFATGNLSRNAFFLAFLDKQQLAMPLIALGAELTQTTVDILSGLPKDNVFFEQSPIPPDQFEEYKQLAELLKKTRLKDLGEAERSRLLDLALRFVPGRHKTASLPLNLETLILEGRAGFKQEIEAADPGAFAFYAPEEYIYSQTILDNILFGKPKSDAATSQEKIYQSIIQCLIAEDLLEAIVEIGMHFSVGSKGDKLSGGQRQKLAIARVFLKRPKILIMDEATSALDNKSQSRIQNLLETRWKGKSTLIAVVHRLDIIKNFDKVAVMKAGKIVELGPYDELMAKKGSLYELVHGKKS